MAASTDTTTNVKVAVRCRPMSRREIDQGHSSIVEVDDAGKTMTLQTERGPRSFTFDHAYGADSSQSQVYEDLALPLVAKAINGYNGTVFAYGQTGSGKTWTMSGNDDHPGIIPHLHQDLFRSIQEQTSDSVKFLVVVSYLEIYNEVIKDLLNPTDKRLRIREHPSTGIFVESLAELVVTSSAEITAYLEQGNAVRKVAATQMNERSSRSHSCFTIRIEQKIVEEIGDVHRETNLFAKINLVDLAGSERVAKTGATGQRLKEGAAINKSLSALANVINALAEGGKKHTPYRDSKLTRLLQQSLGGNSLTCMIATVSPASFNTDETLSTLQYANRAKNIKNETHRNENVQERIIRQLREEIDKLKAELAAARGRASGEVVDSRQSEEDNKKMQEMADMIAALEQAQNSTWEEKERLSRQYAEERAKNLSNTNKIREVMQSMKEENMELLQRVRELQSQKVALTKLYKKQRAEYMMTRDLLEKDTKAYGEVARSGDRNAAQLQEFLSRVNAHKKQLVEVKALMAKTKAAIQDNEAHQTEERASAAMQRKLLVEDAEIRKAIQEDERAKMEAEKAVFLKRALEEERERLRNETEKERAAINAKYAERTDEADEREKALELSLLQANADKHMLRLELEDMGRQHEAEQQLLKRQYVKQRRQEQLKVVAQFKEFCEHFESERSRSQHRLLQLSNYLKQAVDDIVFLTKRNQELETQVQSLANAGAKSGRGKRGQ